LDQVYQHIIKDEERIGITLSKIMIQAAVRSLPQIENLKLEDFKSDEKDIGNNILDVLNYSSDISSIIEQPIISNFRNNLQKYLKENEIFNSIGKKVESSQFVYSYNLALFDLIEEERNKNKKPELEDFFKKLETNTNYKELLKFLKNAMDLVKKKNPIDDKLLEYYVPNRAYRLHSNTWEKSEEEINDIEMQKTRLDFY